jgi:hypothetical protein
VSPLNPEKKIADEGTATLRSALNKTERVTEQTTQATQQSYALATGAIRELNLKLIELARANSDATFDFLSEAMQAKDMQGIVDLWMRHSQREMLNRQGGQLADLGQKWSLRAQARSSS